MRIRIQLFIVCGSCNSGPVGTDQDHAVIKFIRNCDHLLGPILSLHASILDVHGLLILTLMRIRIRIQHFTVIRMKSNQIKNRRKI
jgi:hypothetical protein